MLRESLSSPSLPSLMSPELAWCGHPESAMSSQLAVPEMHGDTKLRTWGYLGLPCNPEIAIWTILQSLVYLHLPELWRHSEGRNSQGLSAPAYSWQSRDCWNMIPEPGDGDCKQECISSLGWVATGLGFSSLVSYFWRKKNNTGIQNKNSWVTEIVTEEIQNM